MENKPDVNWLGVIANVIIIGLIIGYFLSERAEDEALILDYKEALAECHAEIDTYITEANAHITESNANVAECNANMEKANAEIEKANAEIEKANAIIEQANLILATQR